jgi:hypothetical protein
MPPAIFSNIPTLTSPQKLTDIIKIFPKASKFSGNVHKDGQLSVIEILNALTAAQKQCNLSKR